MMVGKEDLGLSLSLGPLHHHHHHQQQQQFLNMSSTCTPVEYRSRPIDVNRAPTTGRDRSEEDLQAGATSSSPNTPASTVSNSAGSGKRDRAASATMDHENEALEERACYSRSGMVSDEEVDADDGSRKKLRLSKDQSVVLEESFKQHNTLNQKEKAALAKQLKLRARQVEVWFQNRRARTKLKQTEVDCEFLRRCREDLTEENGRLQKEVQELRALKTTSPPRPMYMHISTPPITLTMCPSCQRISSASSAPSAQPNHHHHHRPTPPWAPIPLRPSFPQSS